MVTIFICASLNLTGKNAWTVDCNVTAMFGMYRGESNTQPALVAGFSLLDSMVRISPILPAVFRLKGPHCHNEDRLRCEQTHNGAKGLRHGVLQAYNDGVCQ
jgi:hypothetical protein